MMTQASCGSAQLPPSLVMTISFPQPQDYNESLQAPHVALQDPRFRRATIAKNRLGLPRAISGAFASVYEATLPDRTRYAIRCFTRQVPDQIRRYDEISTALERLRLPALEKFEFQKSGIKVGSHLFPILAMKWVDGTLLGEWYRRNISNKVALEEMSRKWLQLVHSLEMGGIAHGDLSHTNVVVVGSDLRLIDYDGFYVPKLKGLCACELGHPNFQHPSRTQRDFGPFLDRFSGWVILAALEIASAEPALVQEALQEGRDECLLFTKADLTDPTNSTLFKRLSTCANPALRTWHQNLVRILQLAPDKVPEPSSLRITVSLSGSVVATAKSWWKNLRGSHSAAPPTATHPVRNRATGSDWWNQQQNPAPRSPCDNPTVCTEEGVVSQVLMKEDYVVVFFHNSSAAHLEKICLIPRRQVFLLGGVRTLRRLIGQQITVQGAVSYHPRWGDVVVVRASMGLTPRNV